MTEIEVAIKPADSNGSYRVDVLRSEAGEASAIVELDVEAQRRDRAELEQAVLSSSSADPAALALAECRLRDIGEVLFSAVLGTGEVAGRYRASAALAARQGEPLRVVLRADTPDLASLTWEAMYDAASGGFVCRREQLVRHVPVSAVAPPLTTRLPLRILGVVSSPEGLPLLDVDQEREQLTQALAKLQAEGLVEVHWTREATWAGLHDLLLDESWHVLHFIGHGRYDALHDRGAVALVGKDGQAEWIEAGLLVDLLKQARPMPRLVVLNSCSGATTGLRDLFSGTGAALARGGISAVVAMQFPISDVAATAFARGFYAAIARGRGVDDATSSGRVAVLGTSAGTLEWVTPVIYLRGRESRLFNLADRLPLDGTA